MNSSSREAEYRVDFAAYARALEELTLRLAAGLVQNPGNVKSLIQRLRRETIEAAFHEIKDPSLRSSLSTLDHDLNLLATSKEPIAQTLERIIRGRHQPAGETTRRVTPQSKSVAIGRN